jgi:hypothetical protein
LSKLFKTFFAILSVFAYSSVSWALEPRDALSARPETSFYMAARVEDLGGALRKVFSPDNTEMITSALRSANAEGFRIVAGLMSQIPAKSVAFAAGRSNENSGFFQAAISIPETLRPKLNLVAEGKALGADLITLLMGEAGLLLAAGAEPALQQGPKGPYYTLGGGDVPAIFAARDNLLLATLPLPDLVSYFDALEDA